MKRILIFLGALALLFVSTITSPAQTAPLLSQDTTTFAGKINYILPSHFIKLFVPLRNKNLLS